MSPEERHEAVAMLAGHATAETLSAAVLLYKAHQEKDWDDLGMESWPAYLESIGVSPSQDSKGRRAVHVFGGAWMQLPVQDQRALTLERLYQAARLTERDDLSIEDGLALAVSMPSGALVAMLKGETFDPVKCACPECGHQHNRKEPV